MTNDANRFKTKMCKNWVAFGECPYEWRCCFAHGEHELRTKQQNVAVGVANVEAMKDFQRQVYRTAFRAARFAVPFRANIRKDSAHKAASESHESTPRSGAEISAQPATKPSGAPSPDVPTHLPTHRPLSVRFGSWRAGSGASFRHNPYPTVTFVDGTP